MKFMKKYLNKIRKNKDGFTLVELVVVLVIIAILMVLMIGTLNGYINKAKEKAAFADCRLLVLSAETVGAEWYASGSNAAVATDFVNKINDLSGFSLTEDGNTKVFYNVIFETDGTVSTATLTEGGVTVEYNAVNKTMDVGARAAIRQDVTIPGGSILPPLPSMG